MNAWIDRELERAQHPSRTDSSTSSARAERTCAANIAAGRGTTFAYFGAGTGTAPLPMYLAYFSGLPRRPPATPHTRPRTSRTRPGRGTSATTNPDPVDAANDLHATRRFAAMRSPPVCAPNFFVMNPAVGNANILRSSGGSRYQSMQVEYRRRLSQGLLSTRATRLRERPRPRSRRIHEPRFLIEDAACRTRGSIELDLRAAGRPRPHFGTDLNTVADGFLGGWELRAPAGSRSRTSTMDGVRLVGMSTGELQDDFKVRTETPRPATTVVCMLPEDIILNTRRASARTRRRRPATARSACPTGRYLAPASDASCIALYPGDCGTPNAIVI